MVEFGTIPKTEKNDALYVSRAKAKQHIKTRSRASRALIMGGGWWSLARRLGSRRKEFCLKRRTHCFAPSVVVLHAVAGSNREKTFYRYFVQST